MARKQGNYGIGAARKGKTAIQSYEKPTKGFNSAGHKRQGDNRYADYPDAPKDNMNPKYAGGTCDGDSGLTPS
jgi:hypothetical protein